MYNEEITIYVFLLLTFIVLVLFIKYYPFKINIQKPSGLKYEKLNLIKGDISILTIKEFNKEIAQLIQNGYALSSLNELYDFVEQQIKLSGKSFVILKEYKKEGKDKAENRCPVVAASAVPQVVKDSFDIRYPKSTVTTWFNKDSVGFCALFTFSGVEKLAEFANNGSFIKEEIETHQEGEHQDSTGTAGKTTTGCECEIHKEGD